MTRGVARKAPHLVTLKQAVHHSLCPAQPALLTACFPCAAGEAQCCPIGYDGAGVPWPGPEVRRKGGRDLQAVR